MSAATTVPCHNTDTVVISAIDDINAIVDINAIFAIPGNRQCQDALMLER